MNKTYYSHGKLLLTGEYVVLDGATALAIPTSKGQHLTVQETEGNGITWVSLDENGSSWFEASFDCHFKLNQTNNKKMAITLLDILSKARQLNPTFLKEDKHYKITTELEFSRDWGLGTSSTLINSIAQWAQVDAFLLLEKSFGGSGYDIAAAQSCLPLFYTRLSPKSEIRTVALDWDFKDQLFFVYLNKKQDSKLGIARYRNKQASVRDIQRITDITHKLLMCYSLRDFEQLMESHESIISNLIELPTVKEQFFSDYKGVVKSLGAWGGDFALATGTALDQEYFREKGYTTIIPFSEMIA
ncbi:MAG: GHMP kinase [Flavobacteriaceae bacterium]|nr:GHMP kinase [Flavobacteriaceae bacterium]